MSNVIIEVQIKKHAQHPLLVNLGGEAFMVANGYLNYLVDIEASKLPGFIDELFDMHVAFNARWGKTNDIDAGYAHARIYYGNLKTFSYFGGVDDFAFLLSFELGQDDAVDDFVFPSLDDQ